MHNIPLIPVPRLVKHKKHTRHFESHVMTFTACPESFVINNITLLLKNAYKLKLNITH